MIARKSGHPQLESRSVARRYASEINLLLDDHWNRVEGPIVREEEFLTFCRISELSGRSIHLDKSVFTRNTTQY